MILKPRRLVFQSGANALTLSDPATTSAGVYDASGNRVRELWSGEYKEAGTYPVYWDGLKDDQTAVSNPENYTVKVTSNTLSVTWEGAIIGNTGDPVTGANKLRGFELTMGVVPLGDTAFWAIGYEEGWPSQFATSIAYPEDGKTWFDRLKETNATSDFIATDGTIVYVAGLDPIDMTKSLVFGFNATTKERFAFSSGSPMAMMWGSIYNNAISTDTNTKHITGLAVQKTANYLFVARASLNQIKVHHKTTGALVQTLTVTNAKYLATDVSNNVWVTNGTSITKHTFNGTALSSALLTISLANIGAIAVNNDGTIISVCDVQDQIVRHYNTSTGAQTGTLGIVGGYLTDATVTNTKFYWRDVRKHINGITTFIAYLPNGDLYVGDPKNRRTQQFTSAGTYVRTISWMIANYSVQVLKNAPSRLFCGWLEFEIDYSKPLAARNGSWTLVKNWEGNHDNSRFNYEETMKDIMVFPNGKTYARIRGKEATSYSNGFWLYELVNGGVLRPIGVNSDGTYDDAFFLDQGSFFGDDGSLIRYYATAGANQGKFIKRNLTGYTSNNPVWQTEASGAVLATVPDVSGSVNSGNPIVLGDPVITPTGVIIFDKAAGEYTSKQDMHIGFIPNQDTSFKWKTARGTVRGGTYQYVGEFPPYGDFDNSNKVNLGLNGAGGVALYINGLIIWTYHGEFWKGKQTNKFNVLHAETGLFLKQFGSTTLDHISDEEAAPNGGDGNVLVASAIEVDGNTYVYTNGESNGIHRWKIENTIISTFSIKPLIGTTPVEGLDLLEGITWGMTTIANGWNGWTRSISPDEIETSQNGIHLEVFPKVAIMIGTMSNNPFKHPDVRICFQKEVANTAFTVSKDLGNNTGLTSWQFNSKMNMAFFSEEEATNKAGGALYIKDNGGKVIAKFNFKQTNASPVIKGNDVTMGTVPANEKFLKENTQSFIITGNAGNITIQYATYSITTTPLDPTSNWQNPKTFEFNAFVGSEVGAARPEMVSIQEMKFYPSITLPA